MSTFDRSLWRDRAAARFDRRSKQKKKDALARYGRDLAAITSIGKVIEWCNKRSLVVSFTNCYGGIYDPTLNSIEINANAEPEFQLMLLLHECGHDLVNKCGDKRIRGTTRRGKEPAGLVFRIDELAEEFEAWFRGRKLAERLGIHVNNERFEKRRAQCLATYAVAVARR